MARTRPDPAIIYVPTEIVDPTEFATVAAPCIERIEACGYQFAGIVRTWDAAMTMLTSGQAHVVIVLHRGHLPRDRRPRVEAADDPIMTTRTESCVAPPKAAGRMRRRPRRVR